MDLEDVTSTIQVMRIQEETAYSVSDYLFQEHSPLHLANTPQCPVDVDCRFKMAEWCYQVVDFCKFNRETVNIAMSYLDRFLCTEVGQEALADRRVFQLAAMTCLYTAVKVHEPEAMEPTTVAGLSRGAYTAEQVEAMERSILEALEWRMNPPTAMAFLQHFFALVSHRFLTPAIRETILDLAKFQIELAVSEYAFATLNPSTVAFSSLMNAVESVDESITHDLRQVLAKSASLDCDSLITQQTQARLYEVITKQPGSPISSLATTSYVVSKHSERSNVHVSPRAVVGTR